MNSKRVLAVVVSVVVVIALVVGGVLLYRSSSTNKKMDDFENTVNTLKDLRLQYSTGSYDAAYQSLVDECNLCLSNKTTGSIDSLTDRIKELKLNIISENKQISDYKNQLTTFQNAISLYVIAGADKTEYNRLLSELDAAIAKSDVGSCNTVSKQLTTLLSKMKTINEQDAAKASDTEKKYKDELEKIQQKLNDNEKKLKENQQSKKSNPPSIVYITPGNGDFICPDSSTRYLNDSDLCNLTKSQLRLARNEIFARHGRKFATDDLNAYFSSKSWYNGYISAKDFNDDCLTKVERSNVAFIQKYEAKFK